MSRKTNKTANAVQTTTNAQPAQPATVSRVLTITALRDLQDKAFADFGALINARQAYNAAAMIDAGKTPSDEDMRHYRALVDATDVAAQSLGRIGASSLYNLLDGRKTGRKVASGLGSSLSIRTWLTHLGFVDGGTTASARKSRADNDYTARTTSFVRPAQDPQGDTA